MNATLMRDRNEGRTASSRQLPGPYLRDTALTLALWYERFRQRRALAAMDDRALKDIGLSRSEVFIEVDKPFWQA